MSDTPRPEFERVKTPRTDAFERWHYEFGNHVSEVFVYARQLECELAEAKEQLRLCNVDNFATAAELAEAVEKERERCARVCEEFYSVEKIAQKCAAAIRKGE